ncbi:MAG TPA: hypothetical protein VFU31_11460, partial [Candidatus Binatia bacterium]|nr:hypothetical protein [Candidatus Binatia bacterium]
FLFLLVPEITLAQAFGDYGRAVGGAMPRQGGGGSTGAPGGPAKHTDAGGFQGTRGVGGRAIPSLLIVASKQAFLYPRQDDETEQIEQLHEGETVVPMIQTKGGNEWYMVKTQKGTMGWIKSSDVREQNTKK